jgi:hypothetical protein
MSPNATTSSGPRPIPAATVASVDAFVTPAALISTSVPTDDQVVTTCSPRSPATSSQ